MVFHHYVSLADVYHERGEMMEYSMQNDGNVEGKIMGKKCIYIYIYIHIFKKRLEMSSRNLWRRSFRGGQIL